MGLYNYFKQIILENVEKDEIVQSIENHNTVLIYYDGDDVEEAGYREIEPVAYGTSLAGFEVVRAFQVMGMTDRKRSVFGRRGWKLFRVDKMLTYNVTDNTFDGPRDKFNPRDDEKMSILFAIAEFEN